MISVGTWLRTIRGAAPRQILGRPSYRLRRRLLPNLLDRETLGLEIAARRAAPAPPPPLAADALAALADGRLLLVGYEAPLPTEPPFEPGHPDPLYRYSFHELGWLYAALAAASPPLRARLGAWLAAYLDRPPGKRSVYWDPYPLGSRILFSRAMIDAGLVSPGQLAPAFARWAAVLAGLTETHLGANHLLRNRAAFAVAAATLDSPAARLVRRSAGRALVKEAARQFAGDGMHEERAPGYHSHALWDLLSALSAMAPHPPCRPSVAALAAIVRRALAALAVVTHADGRPAAFGDTAPASAIAAGELLAWAAGLGCAPAPVPEERSGNWRRRTLARSGYSALDGGELAVYLNGGPFGALHQPGHAHCDLFGFELDLAGARFLVDPGVHDYHDPTWRELSRTSREHATPSIEGRDQAEIWSRFRCGWRPRIRRADWQRVAGGWRFAGEADAFGPASPIRLARTIEFSGPTVSVRDQLDPPQPFSVALTFADETDVTIVDRVGFARRAGHELRLDGGVTGEVELELAHLSHRFGQRAPVHRLRVFSRRGEALSWSISLNR